MENKINKNRNLSMLMDAYEITMSYVYFKQGMKDTKAVFDCFYRSNPDNGGYCIMAGLEQLVDYIQNMHFTAADIKYFKERFGFDQDFLDYLSNFKFTGSIFAVPEGTVVYPNTPIVSVEANIIEAQLMETMILLTINHQTLIATKASRISRAAAGRTVMEFGARRAHSYDAAVIGARAAYIGGVDATATVLADQAYNVPATGTMAHSFIQAFENEYEAFKAYAEIYPDNCSFLIDTYDVLKSGVLNAIRVAKEILEPNGHRLKSIRLDSGDLAYLSKQVRKLLDENHMQDCKIIVSNSMDEYLIESLLLQKAPIDSFGVGERLITSKSTPVFGGVYKLVAIEKNGEYIPKIKKSENVEKITNPGFKRLWRLYSRDTGKSVCDVLTTRDEEINETKDYWFIDPSKPWKKMLTRDFKAIELQHQIFKNGNLIYELPDIESIRKYVRKQLDDELWVEELRFVNPHVHFVNHSAEQYQIKMQLLDDEARGS
ncbi:nicotinate phosphoribosyltransferase [[Clostridium] innocuum]|uniref:nicotinate phosphoribosyltransferase n=1 Tax=Clostridium innocuum TaxID=1522 RepID=UPI000D6C4E7B|nr:nicotinate phosphoribosyltransferase [[Clostridium] innocuum]MCR0316353.1 nicotinate phosphoribosyltransferase [[Clostridium] innocuum]MCR0370920.1 nicotinate phosphoribosyltransferase [[Clostridium] innocuum]MCR0560896.1 nicotinate phosphoribosyltransferase [[Clostridium] innocuum]MCR0603670.1 nicotinate phosphoribosyltransferase [[Clostridium] innocuum]PWJ12048.1 nicotinate phosphoribosyltransferase [[Clostridium] innocuum]